MENPIGDAPAEHIGTLFQPVADARAAGKFMKEHSAPIPSWAAATPGALIWTGITGLPVSLIN